jgi:hypothetical protein
LFFHGNHALRAKAAIFAAISRIHVVGQKNFNAKAQRGTPQPNSHHEGHEDHEEKSYNLSYSILRVLRALTAGFRLRRLGEVNFLQIGSVERFDNYLTSYGELVIPR